MTTSLLHDSFVSSDFPTIVFCMAKGADLVGVRRNSNRVEFEFNDKQKCQELAKEISHGQDMVSGRRMISAMRDAKRIIHDTM